MKYVRGGDYSTDLKVQKKKAGTLCGRMYTRRALMNCSRPWRKGSMSVGENYSSKIRRSSIQKMGGCAKRAKRMTLPGEENS